MFPVWIKSAIFRFIGITFANFFNHLWQELVCLIHSFIMTHRFQFWRFWLTAWQIQPKYLSLHKIHTNPVSVKNFVHYKFWLQWTTRVTVVRPVPITWCYNVRTSLNCTYVSVQHESLLQAIIHWNPQNLNNSIKLENICMLKASNLDWRCTANTQQTSLHNVQ